MGDDFINQDSDKLINAQQAIGYCHNL